MMPFVTEEIHSFLPGRRRRPGRQPLPAGRRRAVDDEAEREVGAVIEAVRRLRNYRDSVGAPAAARIPRPDRRRRATRARSTRSAASRGSTSCMRRRRRRGRRLDRARGRDGRGPAERHGRPGGGAGADRSRARAAARRDRAGRAASSRTRGSPTRRRRSWCRPSARSSSASRPSWPSWKGKQVGLPEASPALREAERYLDSLEMFGMRFGLERMRRLMTALDSPQERFASIHVVGSNGKSSTARMIAALLEQARRAHRRLPVAAPRLVGRADRGRRPPGVATSASPRRSPAPPRRPRRSIARSSPATA